MYGVDRRMVARQYGLSRVEVLPMTVGSATISALVATVLATLLWYIGKRLVLPDWVCMLLFGLGLAVVIIAGPLIRLP